MFGKKKKEKVVSAGKPLDAKTGKEKDAQAEKYKAEVKAREDYFLKLYGESSEVLSDRLLFGIFSELLNTNLALTEMNETLKRILELSESE